MVDTLRIGCAAPFGPRGEPSAIDKHAVAQPLRLDVQGLAGDEQADRRHHGGPEKALHHYPARHYAAWRRECREVPESRFAPGAFGENLSTAELAEDEVCVGDTFRLGGALVQISQARQPCWKLNLRFGLAEMARRVQVSGRTGWYYRVLEAGEVAPGDTLTLVARPHPDWPLSRLLHHWYVDPLNRPALETITRLELLSPSWREMAGQRLDCGQVEDWSRRLLTPAPPAPEPQRS
jgi:MOSC domain-containing protein YiiM